MAYRGSSGAEYLSLEYLSQHRVNIDRGILAEEKKQNVGGLLEAERLALERAMVDPSINVTTEILKILENSSGDGQYRSDAVSLAHDDLDSKFY